MSDPNHTMSELQLFEISNPSDPCTLMCSPNRMDIASAAVWLLSQGFGLVNEKGEQAVPIALFGVPEEWEQQQWGGSFEKFLTDNIVEIADVLESVCTGTAKDRRRYDIFVKHIKDDALDAFRAEWDDEKRSSLNQIANYAHDLARSLRSRAIEAEGGTP